MPRAAAMRAAWVAIGGNCLLLVLKATATSLSDSLTIFSETLNSLADCLAAIVIVVFVRWAWMSPDPDHPFGHRRAEPIAGLVVAIFTGILGFEVCRQNVIRIWEGRLSEAIGWYPMAALAATGVIKSGLAVYFARRGRRLDSPALRALSVDCRNDVLVAAQGLIGVFVAAYKLQILDNISAFIVGAYILYSGHRIGMENIDYLMGRAPDAEMLRTIHAAAQRAAGVQYVDNIKAHYVGTFIHVELTAHVDGELSTTRSHQVAEAVRDSVEQIDAVSRAFVHIEPVARPFPATGR